MTNAPALEAPQDDGGGRGKHVRWYESHGVAMGHIYKGHKLVATFNSSISDDCRDEVTELMTAVNTFESNKRLTDDLVAALEYALDVLNEASPNPLNDEWNDRRDDARKDISAALSKAKAKPGEQK